MTATAVKIGVDGFPIDPLHIYYEQHLAIDLIIEEALKKSNRCHVRLDEYLLYKSYTFWEVSGGRIIDRIILPQSEEITLRTLLDFDVADSWANEIVEQIDLLEESKKEAWIKLLSHASIATQATPTAKWLITARSLLDKVGIANFKGYVSGWFIRVERLPIAYRNRSIADRNPLILTGLVWFYSLLGDEIEVETIADLTVKCYHKIPNIGSVCLKAGNAGLWLLGEIGTFQAID